MTTITQYLERHDDRRLNLALTDPRGFTAWWLYGLADRLVSLAHRVLPSDIPSSIGSFGDGWYAAGRRAGQRSAQRPEVTREQMRAQLAQLGYPANEVEEVLDRAGYAGDDSLERG